MVDGGGSNSHAVQPEVRKGPWTMEEDIILMNYIATHGEGVWNNVACSAGLSRTGKSCRLRWLNYLRPDVRRGNITPEEHMLIVELQSRWGNRWSKIAKHLPGRTDNEIKNFWRTKIHKKSKPGADESVSYHQSRVPADDQPCTNSTIQANCASHDYEGIAAAAAAAAAAARGSYFDHQNNVDHEVAASDQFLAADSNDAFWAVDEDFWPQMQSFNCN